MTRTHQIANLAAAMGLSPANAVALPAVVSVASGRVGMTEPAFIAEALGNAPLRRYLAQVCATAIETL